MLRINARSLTISQTPCRTVIEVPQFTKLLDAHLDVRHNNCLLWSLEDDEEGRAKEKIEIIMLELDQELKPQTAKYVGCFKANSGAIFVFASRASDHPMTVVPYVG